MELIVSYLENQVSGEHLDKARAVLSDSTSQQISAILAQVLGDSPNFDQLPSPAEWFPLATKQIGGVKKLLDEEWAAVESQAQRSAAAANLNLAHYRPADSGDYSAILDQSWIRLSAAQLPASTNTTAAADRRRERPEH